MAIDRKSTFDMPGMAPSSLREINALPKREKEARYRRLIPARLFQQYSLEQTGCLLFVCPEGLGLTRIEVRLRPGDEDCLFFLEMLDTPYGQIELAFCIINAPEGPRFDVDRDVSGRDNLFATVRRNLEAEVRAMQAGLCPHQVRPGLGLFKEFFLEFEAFVGDLGRDTILAEPLSYNNAIQYEQLGFDYITGKQLMLWIDREFRPGGVLFGRLDGTSPFRQPGMERTVRGRSWAIHDGILGRPWDGVKIYKTVDYHAGIDTFPSRTW